MAAKATLFANAALNAPTAVVYSVRTFRDER